MLDIIEPARPAPVAGLTVVSYCADAMAFETWANQWIGDPHLTSIHRLILRYLGASATLGTRSEAVKAVPSANNKMAFFACLDDLAEMNEEVAGMGILSFFNDVSIIGSVAPGFMLYQVRSEASECTTDFQLREVLTDPELERAMSIMRNFLDIIASVTYRYANDPLASATRTYERLFKAFFRLRDQRLTEFGIVSGVRIASVNCHAHDKATTRPRLGDRSARRSPGSRSPGLLGLLARYVPHGARERSGHDCALGDGCMDAPGMKSRSVIGSR